jgi:hypothetical protein
MVMTDKQLHNLLAGFDLGGWKKNGKIYSAISGEEELTEWPEEITLFGHTYTLEDVYDGSTTDKGTFQNATYV